MERRSGKFWRPECIEATSGHTGQKQTRMKMRNECKGKAAQVGIPVSPKVQSLAFIFCTPLVKHTAGTA